MKTVIKFSLIILMGSFFMTSCQKDFLDVNVDPKAASADQVQVEYFINASITGSQQNPHDAERTFILYWKTAARQHRVNGALALGAYNDGWSSDYYGSLSGWLRNATLAITVADEKMENSTDFPYTNNMKQVARIWRVYLMSEFADNFGPMPIDGFQGVNPEFKDLETVYDFMLNELKEATSQLNPDIAITADLAKFDKAYGFDFLKWKKYGNSMRLRLAMRLSEVAPAKAKAEFEAAAASGALITQADETFKVAEMPGGWNDLSGVMTREWNAQPLSATLNNIYTGLGGIPSAQQLPEAVHDHIKPANYMGIRYENHFGIYTNDPSAGFWFDGLPQTIDPRAYKSFIIPGWFTNPDFSHFPSWSQDAFNTERNLLDDNSEPLVAINGAYTWNAANLGNWGDKAPKNQVAFYIGTIPRLSQKFRRGDSERVFFGPWETHFLLAEAAVKGWSSPMSAEAAYEGGIAASFEFWGLNDHVGQYLQSESFNRAGTSVKWSHTANPPASIAMDYIDGYTNTPGTANMNYPQNTIYSGSSNDQLSKIITQKYIAQFPWVPLEAWNDHRRLGLPFFENPSVELPIPGLPNITQGNYMQNSVKNFPQRLKYPSSLENSNPEGYTQAVGFLGGSDDVLTPLWWAKKP